MEEPSKGPYQPLPRNTPLFSAKEFRPSPAPDLPKQDSPQPEPPQTNRNRLERKTPLLITIISWFYLIRGVVFLYCALTLWGAPASDSSAWLVAHSTYIFRMLPRMFTPMSVDEYGSTDIYREVLLLVYLGVGVPSVVIGGMFLALYWRVRWAVICMSGYTLSRIFIVIAVNQVGSSVPLSGGQQYYLFVNAVVNLLIFCYMAFYPGVAQAFEKDDY
jgi:hypothetical protein